MSNEDLESIYGKPYITEDVLNVVVRARDDDILHDDSFKIWERELSVNEQRYLSEFGREVEKFTKDEFAVVIYVALLNYPEMVFQMMMEEYLTNKERKKKNEDSKDV